MLFPGGLALSAEHYVDDTESLYANLSSYNRWYDEAWGFNYQDRIYATALLSLRDLDQAVALTDDFIARGAKVVLLPTGPAYGRSPGDPYFDPVWARLDEAGVVVALHVMPFWYFDAISPSWGLEDDPQSWRMSAWQWMNVYGERPVIDTHLGPDLRQPVRSSSRASRCSSPSTAPAGCRTPSSTWTRAAAWVATVPGSAVRSANGRRRCSERHVRVAPYPEDDIPGIVRELDGDDSVLVFGSDFPHPEGVVTPADFEALLGSLGDDCKRRIMRENAEAIFDAVR